MLHGDSGVSKVLSMGWAFSIQDRKELASASCDPWFACHVFEGGSGVLLLSRYILCIYSSEGIAFDFL